ncbi:MAG: hypothetical protein WD845_11245 [Pirellulales bacterium]
MSRTRRVIKLGGSLLDWPELPAAFASWLAAQPEATNVVVVGGGAIVEALRELDRVGSLGAEACHWLAIHGMSLTAALAAELLGAAELVMGFEQLQRADGDGLFVFDVERFMRADAAGADPLPCSWEVTSDSIAARVAVRLKAEELVLLKSTLPADGLMRKELAASGYVDVYFPQAAAGLRARAVNLRKVEFPQTDI